MEKDDDNDDIKCVIRFYLQFRSETFLILTRFQRDIVITVCKPTHKEGVILFIYIMELDFSRQIFQKCANTKFHEDPSTESRVVSTRTGRHDKANSHFSKFSERVYQST
jgi:hypothetical protein